MKAPGVQGVSMTVRTRTRRLDASTCRPAYRISIAVAEDIPDILALHSRNLVSRGGSLSIAFPAEWFERVMKDMPIVIARHDGRLAGYLVSSSQEATRHLALSQAKYQAYPAGPDAYNSGPLCISASDRGQGVAAKLFEAQRSLLRGREGVAFIREDNAASRAVHARCGFREVAAFAHAGVGYVVVSYSDDALHSA
jgi:L-amino acid N-acyltransferase YncA